MDDAMLERTGVFLKEMSDSRGGEEVSIIWHGGEVLILDTEYFYRAGKIFDRTIGEHFEMLQSSMIPFKENQIQMIHDRMGGCVGSSVDFSQRKINDSVDKYLDLWMTKVALARKNNINVIPSLVPTTNELGKEGFLLDWMIDNDFPEFNIDRYNTFDFEDKVDDYPSNRLHADFLIALFDAVFKKKAEGVSVPYINVIGAGVMGVLKGMSGERWGTTCQNDFVVIEPNGSLNSCPNRTTFENPFSNVVDGFNGFASSKPRRKWIRIAAIEHAGSGCSECEFFSWCKSGCPINPQYEDGECSGYKKYLKHIQELAKDEINKKAFLSYIEY